MLVALKNKKKKYGRLYVIYGILPGNK